MAAALAAVDAAPLADARGTFWPYTSEISFLEAAVLGGHAELAQRLARSGGVPPWSQAPSSTGFLRAAYETGYWSVSSPPRWLG